MNKRLIYWVCQIGGWSLYGVLQLALYASARQTPGLDTVHILGEFTQMGFYLLSTHFLRYILVRFGWLNYSIARLTPRILSFILLLSSLNFSVLLLYAYFAGELTVNDFLIKTVVFNILGTAVVYILWSMIYLTFHYFERYNKSLKYEAAAKEIELRNLRSQLNPHFIFNALNSIRALVDEDPIKSKSAITQLSNILRNSLTIDRQRLVTFSEEMEMVKDYLALETIRYEERLKTKFDIDNVSLDYLIPPLMIQTLVENGIKHGISTLRNGGVIEIHSKVESDRLLIQIRNAGQYLNGKVSTGTGFGLSNTRKRLELIYGDQATFRIVNENKKTVLTEVVLPKTL
ncbi:MAG: histidine kinase [Flammeovirgaceae bacterium]|nr:histidine kinase [Flammeovirgaceae bacterium]MBE62810.1 histidine kinase [Flammeovirgaceae bacterium]MBR06116.1 histidine kinase [Rickettsiales bacterium]HCX20280.1 histidine kinase [Cytophagales bacterium]|tara:strand:- start:1858 stop:2892 length:1035 start_codon:yes stop_codon:yes gene_type:complete